MRRFDWQRKRAEEKRRLIEERKEAICERCGKTFVYHPYPGFDKPRFDTLTCKSISDREKKDGK
jgi:hypothetical protein